MQDSGATDLARALLGARGDEDCAACLDRLEAYVTAQIAGEPYAERFPAVAGHLDSCVACAEVYAQLYEVLAGAPAMPAPARIPEPDLSFLPRRADPRASLAQAIERLGTGLRLTLSSLLLDLFAPGPAAAPALRGEGPGLLLDLAVEETGGAIAGLRLQARPAAGDPDHCDLRVQVELSGREWPDLAGASVAIELGGERREARTDAWGEAAFEGLRRDELPGARLEVSPPADG